MITLSPAAPHITGAHHTRAGCAAEGGRTDYPHATRSQLAFSTSTRRTYVGLAAFSSAYLLSQLPGRREAGESTRSHVGACPADQSTGGQATRWWGNRRVRLLSQASGALVQCVSPLNQLLVRRVQRMLRGTDRSRRFGRGTPLQGGGGTKPAGGILALTCGTVRASVAAPRRWAAVWSDRILSAVCWWPVSAAQARIPSVEEERAQTRRRWPEVSQRGFLETSVSPCTLYMSFVPMKIATCVNGLPSRCRWG